MLADSEGNEFCVLRSLARSRPVGDNPAALIRQRSAIDRRYRGVEQVERVLAVTEQGISAATTAPVVESKGALTVEPGKMNGQPCIRGLRFAVANLLRIVAAGWSLDQIQEEFPFIEAEDIEQALLYAVQSAEVTALPLRDTA